MPGLLDKLNTLVRSSVNSVLDDVPGRKSSVNPARLGKDIDQEVAALRKRIDAAGPEPRLAVVTRPFTRRSPPGPRACRRSAGAGLRRQRR